MSEVKFEPFQRVLARVTHSKIWFATLFSHYAEDGKMASVTAHLFDEVLPYNDETKHLLGTTDDPEPPEAPFKWGDHVEVRDDETSSWIKAIYLSVKIESYYCVIEPHGTCLWKFCRHADW